jgi:hypothetical protein
VGLGVGGGGGGGGGGGVGEAVYLTPELSWIDTALLQGNLVLLAICLLCQAGKYIATI